MLVVRKVCSVILVSVPAIMSNNLFVHLSRLTTFVGSLFFSGEVLLNWLWTRANSEWGLSESKLSSLLLPCWERAWYGRE